MAMSDHKWPEVMAALQDWVEDSRENEPYASALHAALDTVLAAMPDEAYE